MRFVRWTAIIALFGGATSALQASTIQIDDLTDTLVLIVDGKTINGNGGNINGYSNSINARGTEILSFVFTSTVAWAANTTQFTQMNGPGEPASDLFLISGTQGSFLDVVNFLSDDAGNVDTNPPPAGYTASSFNPVSESGNYQNVFQTVAAAGVVDTYQVRSDAPSSEPEPSTFSLYGLGLGSLYFIRHRPRRERAES